MEPLLAKRLRKLLIEEAAHRSIVVATHSHLFIDRKNLASTCVVDRSVGAVRILSIATQADLIDLVFRLLGNATEDLLLPANFLVVEGSSDAVIVERVVQLLGVPPGKIKVFSGTGLDDVPVAVSGSSDCSAPPARGRPVRSYGRRVG